jgi:hypothetical protein
MDLRHEAEVAGLRSFCDRSYEDTYTGGQMKVTDNQGNHRAMRLLPNHRIVGGFIIALYEVQGK